MRPRGLRDEVLRARAAALEGYAVNPTLSTYFDVSSYNRTRSPSGFSED